MLYEKEHRSMKVYTKVIYSRVRAQGKLQREQKGFKLRSEIEKNQEGERSGEREKKKKKNR